MKETAVPAYQELYLQAAPEIVAAARPEKIGAEKMLKLSFEHVALGARAAEDPVSRMRDPRLTVRVKRVSVQEDRHAQGAEEILTKRKATRTVERPLLV